MKRLVEKPGYCSLRRSALSYVNEDLMQRFRLKLRCELCEKAGPVDPHHLMTRGAGRVDHPSNLVALCRACHRACESDVRVKAKVWAVVCAREGLTEEEIRQKVWDLRRKSDGD